METRRATDGQIGALGENPKSEVRNSKQRRNLKSKISNLNLGFVFRTSSFVLSQCTHLCICGETPVERYGSTDESPLWAPSCAVSGFARRRRPDKGAARQSPIAAESRYVGGFRAREGGRYPFMGRGSNPGQTRSDKRYLRRPRRLISLRYRLRSSRVRYFSRLLRRPTILRSPRREE